MCIRYLVVFGCILGFTACSGADEVTPLVGDDVATEVSDATEASDATASEEDGSIGVEPLDASDASSVIAADAIGPRRSCLVTCTSRSSSIITILIMPGVTETRYL